jgi:tryptophan synthase alpha chain
MNILEKHLNELKAKGETIIVPYIMAGDHSKGLNGLGDTISFLQESGVSAVEIGIPFSDPVADGEVIQKAGLRALARDISLMDVVKKLQKIKAKIPLVIMSYFNPIYNIGVEKFIAELKDTDVKGLIIPDLPFEHRDLVEPFLEGTEISLLRLLSLTTTRERQKTLLDGAQGFIYAVALNGITGMGREYRDDIYGHLKYMTDESKIPVLAGFGVSSVEHVQKFREVCDGVIVGSFIVNALHSGEKQKVADFIKKSKEIK